MSEQTAKKEYLIDASGKRLGRVATEAASLLIGKNSPALVKNAAPEVTVKIANVGKLDVTEKKKGETYQTYSGYPGGRKVETFEHLSKRRGFSEAVRRTVQGMLPKNKLQKQMLANLEITE